MVFVTFSLLSPFRDRLSEGVYRRLVALPIPQRVGLHGHQNCLGEKEIRPLRCRVYTCRNTVPEREQRVGVQPWWLTVTERETWPAAERALLRAGQAGDRAALQQLVAPHE